MSLGFEQAGFDIVAAVEIDPVHSATHKFNFPNCAVLPVSAIGLSGADIRKAAGLGDSTIDVVFGGAPCQGFSLIGHRALDDKRNTLVGDFVRIVSELNASYFVFENVKGITIGKHKAFLAEVIEAFAAAGYDVRLPWRVLDAADYGVPQHRERLILFGARKGFPMPSYPQPSCRPASSLRLNALPIGPTCSDALGDIPDADIFPELLELDSVETKDWGQITQYAREMRCLDNDAWHFGYARAWQPNLLTSSARAVHTTISQRRFAETQPGQVEPISRFFRLSPDGLSNTLRAGTDASRGAFTSPRPIHYGLPRCITVREMARLHGFPDWFRFQGSKWHGARQVGNAVPPPLARAVAASVIAALSVNPSRPERTLTLGDPLLIRMGTSAAARHFDILAPIAKRDRKSGAKKRKQHTIEEKTAMVGNEIGRYKRLIEHIFFDPSRGYSPRKVEVPFERQDIEAAAVGLGINLPKNIGDVLYAIRYRTPLPGSVLATQPESMEWIIEGDGRSRYKFCLVPINRIVPNTELVTIKIPDSTPEIIAAYALTHESPHFLLPPG